MTTAQIIYNLRGIQKKAQGQQVGQLVVVRAHWLDENRKTWKVTTSERYDLIHVKSSLRIDTVECSYLEALKIAESLTSLDFDTFYENTKRGIRDAMFVEMVRLEIGMQTWQG